MWGYGALWVKLSPPASRYIYALCAKSLQLCPTLCDPMDCSPPGSSVHGFLQARIPEWVAVPFSRASSQPKDWTLIFYVSCIGRRVLYHQHHHTEVLTLWMWCSLVEGCSCLENPMDGGAWWAAVHGVAESRTRLSDFPFTFHFHALEKEMATHSSVLA